MEEQAGFKSRIFRVNVCFYLIVENGRIDWKID